MTTGTTGGALARPQNQVDYDVAMEIASHEAIVQQAYKDSEGVWTWGVGLTSASGHNVERYIGKPQSLEHCLSVYAWALSKYAEEVREAFAGYQLTKAQFAGAMSFHWNTGAIKTATWVKRWKAGDIKGAREAFLWYNQPASIIPRREKERDLFFDGKWSNDGTMIEYTRLTSKNTPDWSSAKRINVRKELMAAVAPAFNPIPVTEVGADPVPIPRPPDIEPLTPAPVPPAQPATSGGLFAALLKGLLETMFGRKA